MVRRSDFSSWWLVVSNDYGMNRPPPLSFSFMKSFFVGSIISKVGHMFQCAIFGKDFSLCGRGIENALVVCKFTYAFQKPSHHKHQASSASSAFLAPRQLDLRGL